MAKGKDSYKPWQCEWKRPMWREINPLKACDGESILGSQNNLFQGAVMSTDAAFLDESEVNSIGIITRNKTRLASNEPPQWILIVQLIRDENSSLGSRLFLQLSDSSSIVTSKHLQWPGSMFEGFEYGSGDGGGGIISIAFCRKPQHVNDTYSSISADALDVINLMSLGIFDRETSLTPAQISIQIAKQRDSSTIHMDSEIEEIEAVMHTVIPETTELFLACLTSDGKVHIYQALHLLQKSCPVEEEEDILQTGLANLFFGTDVLDKIRDALFPLSQPQGTVYLSLPLNPSSHRTSSSPWAKWWIPSPTVNEIPIWGEALWNSTVEPSTICYRTFLNKPENLVAVPPYYVAVFGRGTRLVKRRKSPSVKRIIIEGLEHLPEDSRSEDLDGEENWWKHPSQQNDPEFASDSDDKEEENENNWRNSSTPTDKNFVETLETGGFITFINLHHASEARTLYLPFAPKSIHPVNWGALSFVIALADESSTPNKTANAIAIRVDAGGNTFFDCGSNPSRNAVFNSLEDPAEDKCLRTTKTVCQIKRFNIIPIILPFYHQLSNVRCQATSVTSIDTKPPGIELLVSTPSEDKESFFDISLTLNTLHCFDRASISEIQSPSYFQASSTSIVVIRTVARTGTAALLPSPYTEDLIRKAWSQSFQGCSLFCINHETYFISWEGATSEGGASIQAMKKVQLLEEDSMKCTILSLQHSIHDFSNIACCKPSKFEAESAIGDNNFRSGVSNRLGDDGSLKTSSDLIVDALDSISSLSYRDAESSPSLNQSTKVKRSQRLSHREKSERLVQNCNTWTLLNDTEENRSLFESQLPLVIFAHSHKAQYFSLRHRSIVNGDASPFDHVLSWLSLREDYFIAANIALALLGDTQCRRILLNANDCTLHNEFDDKDSDDGLLDGIALLYPNNPGSRASKSDISKVADLAIGCMAKGGLKMSKTLDFFVQRNKDFDPNKASLMLVAIATKCVSRDEETVKEVMGHDYRFTDASNPDDLLWAFRILILVGVQRDQLSQAMLLVNVAMPDEIRCRKSKILSGGLLPNKRLSRTMITIMISASPDSASIMLDLVDEETRKRYWWSLSREVQLDFSLIHVKGCCPLLLQPEIRHWAISCLDECITQESLPSAIGLNDLMPTEWLQMLCEGCLLNAGCNFQSILEASNHVEDADEFLSYFLEFNEIQSALRSSSGLDFDLFIPALLILNLRDMDWKENISVSTQRLLDGACHLAGRRKSNTFLFDFPRVMKQCGAAGNVSAGANLVGGKSGLILACCDILRNGAGLDLERAEAFITEDKLAYNVVDPRITSFYDQNFTISDNHRKIVWLLSHHVLSVRTFGEFRPVQLRDKVDPVFAARACLRCWFALSSSGTSVNWLVKWLREQLEIDDEGISPKRLACAALVQVLLWPSSDESPDVLATIMGIESTFLVQLAQACHGLIECLPSTLAQKIAFDGSKGIFNSSLQSTSSIEFPCFKV